MCCFLFETFSVFPNWVPGSMEWQNNNATAAAILFLFHFHVQMLSHANSVQDAQCDMPFGRSFVFSFLSRPCLTFTWLYWWIQKGYGKSLTNIWLKCNCLRKKWQRYPWLRYYQKCMHVFVKSGAVLLLCMFYGCCSPSFRFANTYKCGQFAFSVLMKKKWKLAFLWKITLKYL